MTNIYNTIGQAPHRVLWGAGAISIAIAAYSVITLLSPPGDTPEQSHARSQARTGTEVASQSTHSSDAEHPNQRSRDEFYAAIAEAIASLTRDGDLGSALQAIEMAVDIAGSAQESEARTLLLNAEQALHSFFESSAYRESREINDVPDELMQDYWKIRDILAKGIADNYLDNPHAQTRDPEGFGIAMLNAAQFAMVTGDRERALAVYRSIADEYAHQLDAELVAQAISAAGSLATQMGQREQGEIMYDRLIDEYPMPIDSMQAVKRQIRAAANPTQAGPSERALGMFLDLWQEPFVRENNPAAILVAQHLGDQLRQQGEPSMAIEVYQDLLARVDRITPEDVRVYTMEFGFTFTDIHRTAVSHTYDLAMILGDYGLAHEMANLYAEHYDEPANPSGAIMADRALRALERHLQTGTP